MSVNRSNSPPMLDTEEYHARKAQIAALKAQLDQWEERIDQKKQNYEAFMQQLEDKVRQGDEAKRMLEAVKQQEQGIIIVPPATQSSPFSNFQASAPQFVNVPSSSRIEEVSQYEYASSNPHAPTQGYQHEPAWTQATTSRSGASSVTQSSQRNQAANQSHFLHPDQWSTQSTVHLGHPQYHGHGENNKQPHRQRIHQTQPHQLANPFPLSQGVHGVQVSPQEIHSRAQAQPKALSQAALSLQFHASAIGNTSSAAYRPAHVRHNESSSLAGALGERKGIAPATRVASTASTRQSIRTVVPSNPAPEGSVIHKLPPPANTNHRVAPLPSTINTALQSGSEPTSQQVVDREGSRGMTISIQQDALPPSTLFAPKTGATPTSASESARAYFAPLHSNQRSLLERDIHNCQVELHPGTFRILSMSPYLRIFKDALSATSIVFPGHDKLPYSLSVNDFISLLRGNSPLQTPQKLSPHQWPMSLPERKQIFTPATNPPSIPVTPNNLAPGNKESVVPVAPSSSEVSVTPHTSRPLPSGGSLRSPAHADKRTLARDVMFALGKRGRESSSLLSLGVDREVKRHATEQKVQGATVVALPTSQAGRVDGLTSSPSSTTLRPRGSENIEVINNPQALLPPNKLWEGTEVNEATVSLKTPIAVIPTGTTQPISENDSTSTAQAVQPSIPLIAAAQTQDLVDHSSTSTRTLLVAGPSISSARKVLVDIPLTQQKSMAEPSTVTPSASTVGDLSIASTLPARKPLVDLPSPARNAFSDHGVELSSSPPPKKDDPLFLPSPSSSPTPGYANVANDDDALPIVLSGDAHESTVDTTESTTIDNKKQIDTKDKQRKQPFYILIPPAPEYLIRFRAKQAKKERQATRASQTYRTNRDRTQTQSLAPFTPGEDFDFTFDSQGRTTHDEEEREAMHLACSRVQEAPCKWGGCDVVMNSVEGLVIHVKSHFPDSNHTKPKPYTCLWRNCGRRCRVEENHVEMHHALSFLKCAYEGCEDAFRSSAKLLKHIQAEHKNDKPRPPRWPTAPILEGPLPPAPPVLPSYMVLSRKVQQASIPDDRHARLGPWVLRNIAGVETQRPNKQKAARSTRRRIRDGVLDQEVIKTYEYLTRRSTRYSSSLSEPVDMPLEKLDSAAISEMLSEGLSLWDNEEEEESEEGTQVSTPPPVSIGLTEDIKAEGLDVTIEHLHNNAAEGTL